VNERDAAACAEAAAARAGIENTLALYCEKLDEYDLAGVAGCFTAEAQADYGPGRGGVIGGRAGIVARIEKGKAVFRRTHHQLGQSRIALHGDAAEALTYVTAWHERFGGEREIVCLRYRDMLHREAERWRIARRSIEVALVDGFPGVQWNWVKRAVAKLLPERPLRRWVLSLPFALRFLLATDPDSLTRVLGTVYRAISGYQLQKTGLTRATGHTGAVTLLQRFGLALNLNIQCAVQRHGLPVGANPTRRRSLQPVAIGAVVMVTERLEPSM
jgi:hypothetical protein